MWWLFPLSCFVAVVGLHAVAARLRPAGNRVNQFLLVGGIGGLVVILAGPAVPWPERLAGVAAYAFACELYLFLFTFVISSVTVALLLTRRSGPAAGISLQPAEMVQRRLRTMAAAGLLRQDGERFALTAKARRVVRVYRIIRRLVHDADPSVP